MSYRNEPYNETYFNDIDGVRVGGYTHYPTGPSLEIHQNRADDIETYFGPFKKQDKILVVGNAYGYLVDILAQKTGEPEVIGVDISSYAIGQAETLFPTRTFENIDFFDNSFAPNTFDVIVLCEVVDCMPDKATCDLFFDEVARITATGGGVYCLMNDTDSFYMIITDSEWQEYIDTGVMFGKSIEITHSGDLPICAEKRIVIS